MVKGEQILLLSTAKHSIASPRLLTSQASNCNKGGSVCSISSFRRFSPDDLSTSSCLQKFRMARHIFPEGGTMYRYDMFLTPDCILWADLELVSNASRSTQQNYTGMLQSLINSWCWHTRMKSASTSWAAGAGPRV